VIVTSTLWPGASTPLDGLKVICPGTFVKANQCRLLWLLVLESTRAKQMKAPFLLQSRCPTMLIDNGRRSRMAGADAGAGGGCDTIGCSATAGCAAIGCGAAVGFGVGMGVGTCVGIVVGTDIDVEVAVAAAAFACPVAAEPQEARTTVTRMARVKTTKMLCVSISLRDCERQATGPRKLRCHILILAL